MCGAALPWLAVIKENALQIRGCRCPVVMLVMKRQPIATGVWANNGE